MAINNLYVKCSDRPRISKGKTSGIYHNIKESELTKDFNNMKLSGKLATEQIELVGKYIEDFNNLIAKMKEDEKNKKKAMN